MITELLRIYDPENECGDDGYPFAWHRRTDFEGYLDELPAIKYYIRDQVGYRCIRCGHPYTPGIAKTHPRGEWTPCDEHCTHGEPIRLVDLDGVAEPFVQAQWRILTVHHLNGVKYDCRWWNLAALCQRCHLTIQGKVYMDREYVREHSEWFKPYAAGWYAVKYLNQELDREEVMVRLDELLSLEQTQYPLPDLGDAL